MDHCGAAEFELFVRHRVVKVIIAEEVVLQIFMASAKGTEKYSR